MINLLEAIRTAILFTCLAIPALSLADELAASRLVMEAKQALDEHYGDRAQLTLAAGLLSRALAESKDNAEMYVQAARLTIKGGHVVAMQFRPGTLQAYGELLDRALALDPNNAKAHILKAEYLHGIGAFGLSIAELDKAKDTGTKDSWLLIGYGRSYRSTGELEKSFNSYAEARARGAGENLEQRNAYVAALNGLATFAAAKFDESALRELQDEILKARDPRDAWALGSLAESLVRAGMFGDAIEVSREALRTMNYGAGRLTLAAALFGKAAELTLGGKPDLAAPLINEARSYGFDKTAVFRSFTFGTKKIVDLIPTLETLVQ